MWPGLAAMTAYYVLGDGIASEIRLVLIAIGGLSFFAYFVLFVLSRREEKWTLVRRGLRLSVALLVSGAAALSAGFFLNLFYAAALAAVLLISAGIAASSLGILALLGSFAEAGPRSSEKA